MSLTREEVELVVDEARSKYMAPNLYGADLYGANLYGVNLRGASLGMSDLSGAGLRRANLSRANLYGANLRGADLTGANLYQAYLHGANLIGTGLLRLDGLPSGQATLVPTWQGWTLVVGCWSGTVQDLRDLIAGDDWPEADYGEQDIRRPGLELLADLCDDHISLHPDVVPDLARLWGEPDSIPTQPNQGGTP